MKTEEFQTFINEISSSFAQDDFWIWRDHVRLPLTFVTKGGVTTFETEAALRADYEGHIARFRAAGVTEIRRSVRSVEMIDATQAIATYDTDILRGNELVYMPYTSSMMLSREPADGWRCTTIMNALGSHTSMAPPGTQAIDRSPEAAMEIYQRHLDVVSRSMMMPGMPDVCANTALPIILGTLDAETQLQSYEELMNLIGSFVQNMRDQGVTDYIRIAKSARFTSATRIEGWHVTHMLRSGTHLVDPYKCEAVLDFEEGVWRISKGLSQTFTHVTGLLSPEIAARRMPASSSKPRPDRPSSQPNDEAPPLDQPNVRPKHSERAKNPLAHTFKGPRND
jgi:hypothetical protein